MYTSGERKLYIVTKMESIIPYISVLNVEILYSLPNISILQKI